MLCPNCRTPTADRQKFCHECGASLVRLCPRCSSPVLQAHKFCGECGLNLEAVEGPKAPEAAVPEGERKHVTVLFSDLAGYTRLADDHDPEEVRDISGRIFAEIARIIAESQGFIEKFVGDAVLAIFGLPAVHEDDPLRAVGAALKIHRRVHAMRDEKNPAIGHSLRMHSGIHTGLVVTGEMNVAQGIHGVVGDTLNLASRLADAAQPGEILVSPQTHRLVAPYFETRAVGPLRLKGIARSISPFRIVGELGVGSRFEAAKRQGFSAFTGREEELHRLQGCLDKALAGKGQIVTITGEAGMGKSRLAYEFCHNVDRRQVAVLQGRCRTYGTNTPYLPILNALRHYLAPKERLGRDQQEASVVETVLAIDPALERYLPLYLYLLSIPSRSYPLPDHLVGQKLKNAINQALAAMLLLSARRKPTILVLDDWHWVDEASDSSLMHLAGLMEEYPLMLLVTYRPERAEGWPDWHFRTSCVLKALDGRHTERIIRSNWKVDALPEGFAAFIHDHTGGNPLFIEEVSRT
ncbi:MAG TPA: AAA family ATPase, partial [Desulfosarcina sp.]|nr:AAA family ATPase [Desulfosarcina sp.]